MQGPRERKKNPRPSRTSGYCHICKRKMSFTNYGRGDRRRHRGEDRPQPETRLRNSRCSPVCPIDMNLVATFGEAWKTVHDTIRTVTVAGSDARATPQLIVPMNLPLAIPWRVAFQQSSPLLYQPSAILKEKRKFEKKNPKAAGVPNNLCHLT